MPDGSSPSPPPTRRRLGFRAYLLDEWKRYGSLYPVTDSDERPEWGGTLEPTPEPAPPELYAMTHQQIADAFAADGDPVSREYVRQLEVSALAKCRRAFLRLGITQP